MESAVQLRYVRCCRYCRSFPFPFQKSSEVRFVLVLGQLLQIILQSLLVCFNNSTIGIILLVSSFAWTELSNAQNVTELNSHSSPLISRVPHSIQQVKWNKTDSFCPNFINARNKEMWGWGFPLWYSAFLSLVVVGAGSEASRESSQYLSYSYSRSSKSNKVPQLCECSFWWYRSVYCSVLVAEREIEMDVRFRAKVRSQILFLEECIPILKVLVIGNLPYSKMGSSPCWRYAMLFTLWEEGRPLSTLSRWVMNTFLSR